MPIDYIFIIYSLWAYVNKKFFNAKSDGRDKNGGIAAIGFQDDSAGCSGYPSIGLERQRMF